MVISWCYRKWKYSVNFCLVEVNNRNTRTRREICSKLTIKTPRRRHWLYTIFRSLMLFWFIYCYLWTYLTPCSSVSIVDFEQTNCVWEKDLWRKGLITSFVFTRRFQQISTVRVSIAIHFLVFFIFLPL